MRLIDRDKLIKDLSTMYKWPTSTEDFMTIGYDHAIADVVVTVHEQPTAQPEIERLSPCDVCKYTPPSAMDGKPCGVCPAEGKETEDE